MFETFQVLGPSEQTALMFHVLSDSRKVSFNWHRAGVEVACIN